MKRRQFIALFGGAVAAWPLASRAQQPTMPVIGFLHPGSPESRGHFLTAFRQGLGESGYIEGRNVTIEYRWGEDRYDRLPELAADLARRRVSVIVAMTDPAAIAAKTATASIPIAFGVGLDPVELGLVASLNRPGGNATGMAYFTRELLPKRLGLLHELIPQAARIAVLANPADSNADSATRDLKAAASAIRQPIEVFHASSNREIDTAFAMIVQKRADALLTIPDTLFLSRRVQIVSLATRYAIPAMFSSHEWVEIGGLMSYATSLPAVFRRHLYRPHAQGRKARRHSGGAGDEVRVRHQSADGKTVRSHCAGRPARNRRRGDRVMARHDAYGS
jgi:putative ABC transport system substrate-binding protein